MNEMMIFSNPEFGNVRTVTIDGNPWFVGNDVAKALGYVKERNAIANHGQRNGKDFDRHIWLFFSERNQDILCERVKQKWDDQEYID